MAGARPRDDERELAHAHTSIVAPRRDAADELVDLASAMRHELRSPLQTIQGFSELLGSEPHASQLTSEHRAFVGHIFEAGLELSAVIGAYFDALELERGRRSPFLSQAKLGTLVREALEQAPRIKRLSLETRIDADCEELELEIDQSTFRHALAAAVMAIRAHTREPLWAVVQRTGNEVSIALSPEQKLGSEGPLRATTIASATPRQRLGITLATRLLAHLGATLWLSDDMKSARIGLACVPATSSAPRGPA